MRRAPGSTVVAGTFALVITVVVAAIGIGLSSHIRSQPTPGKMPSFEERVRAVPGVSQVEVQIHRPGGNLPVGYSQLNSSVVLSPEVAAAPEETVAALSKIWFDISVWRVDGHPHELDVRRHQPDPRPVLWWLHAVDALHGSVPGSVLQCELSSAALRCVVAGAQTDEALAVLAAVRSDGLSAWLAEGSGREEGGDGDDGDGDGRGFSLETGGRTYDSPEALNDGVSDDG